MNADNVRDFASADAYLGKKLERPLCNNTRLVRLNAGEIGVKLHNTYVVVYVADGTLVINYGGWYTPTTLNRIHRFSPARVYGHAVRHASDPLTPPKVWKCRTCHGTGKGFTSTSCAECGQHVHSLTDHGRCDYTVYPYVFIPADHPYVEKRAEHDCYRCGGTGRIDYGSNPIPYKWDGGALHIDATGKPIPDVPVPIDWEPLDLSTLMMPKQKTYATASGYYAQEVSSLLMTPSIDFQLRAVFPALSKIVSCHVCGSNTLGDVGALVIHLNDTHKWTREAIADWLESTDIDLRFHAKEVRWEPEFIEPTESMTTEQLQEG